MSKGYVAYLIVDGDVYDTICFGHDFDSTDDEARRITGYGDGDVFTDFETGYDMTVSVEEYESPDEICNDYDIDDDDGEFSGDPWHDLGLTIHDFI